MMTWLLERNWLPDFLIRLGIRRLLKQRLREEDAGNVELQQDEIQLLTERLRQSPVAIHTGDANEQHYEVPTQFFQYVLGKNMKYSSAYWEPDTRTLDEAERRMLEMTCRRAELAEGQRILELGCGWGSLSLYMAEQFPTCRIISVSNSATQKQFIDEQIRLRGLTNVTVITRDMNEFDTKDTFDRVVSVEMFEHMRNYETLMANISRWLVPGGKLFVHIFTHKTFAYPFEARDESDWMARYFFTGGIMPSDHLLLYFTRDLSIDRHWVVNGQHYGKTAEAWLTNMTTHRTEIMPILRTTYGASDALRWWVFWRCFFMACAELWNFRRGNEWFVSHYLFTKRPVEAA